MRQRNVDVPLLNGTLHFGETQGGGQTVSQLVTVELVRADGAGQVYQGLFILLACVAVSDQARPDPASN